MSDTVIRVENLSKQYRLGTIGSGTLRDDVDRLWARVRGKPDPLAEIGNPAIGHAPRKTKLGLLRQDPGERRKGAATTLESAKTLWALRDVSFDVKQGEVVGIIGRNGAGKSTLLKILARITAPTSGVVKVKGRIASLLEVGTGFHPELTGRENIFLNGAILGMKRAEIANKFDEIVSFAEVEQFIDTPVKRYSSGMHVRLAFAVAAHLEPEILLVDEVLAVGDAAFQKKCLGKMGDVAKQGRTVLFVSHNMTAIQTLCRSALWIAGGELCDRGEAALIIRSYLAGEDAGASGEGQYWFGEDTFRNGTGAAKFVRAAVRDAEGRIAHQIPMGSKFSIELEFETEQPLSGPIFTIGIENQMRQRIVTISNSLVSGNLPGTRQGGKVVAYFEPLNLLPGIYHVSLGLSIFRELSDWIPDSVSFEITPYPVYPTGKLPGPNGVIFANCSFRYEYT